MTAARDELFTLPVDGPRIATERDATDLVGEAMFSGATTAAIPVERLSDAFFTLSTGLFGAMAQKFVNYQIRLVIVGDVSRHVERSDAFRDFVREANRGRHLWFVDSLETLKSKLAQSI